MDPLTILATVDAAITAYERAMVLLEKARQEGIVTAEQQSERMGNVRTIRERVGLPPGPDAPSSGPSIEG